jgi:beta-glucanase (GH16 family)
MIFIQKSVFLDIFTDKAGKSWRNFSVTFSSSERYAMKPGSGVLVAVLLCSGAAAPAFDPFSEGYGLYWSDEFDGAGLDTSVWSYRDGDLWSSSEVAYYTKGANLTMENGCAVLWAKKEQYQGRPYTSCRLVTLNKKQFTYGYIEARIKAPSGRGLWPSFWMAGNNIGSAGWPACGEIDVYEQRTGSQLYSGTPGDNCYMTGCYFKAASGGTSYNNFQYNYAECLCGGFHTYAVAWDSLRIRYFFDGNQVWEYDTISASYNYASFHQPFVFYLNLDVGGTYVGTVDNSIFPQAMYVDYVRVYQKDAVRINNNAQKNVVSSLNLIDPTKAHLKIYDLQGRFVGDYTDKIQRMKYGESIVKSMSSILPIGIYVARFSGGAKSMSERLVVAK